MNIHLNELFFIPNTIPSKEIDNYYSLNDFHNVLINECNFCNDDNLNRERLNVLYKKYVTVFTDNKGHLRDYFLKTLNCKRFILKPYAVFGESLWKNTKSTTSLEFFLNLGYNYEYAQILQKKRQNTISKESFQKRYGDDWEIHLNLWKKRYHDSLNSNPNINEINYRKGNSMRYEFYLDKINPDTNKFYTEDEAKEKIRIKAKKASDVSSKNTKGKSGVTCRSVQYWINKGLNEDEAKNKVKEIQATNNIETYIKKYGEQDGIQRWVKRNKKWGEIMQKKRMESGHIGSAYSQSSKVFFDGIVSKLNDECIYFDKIYYGEQEFCKWDSENKRPYFYDFVIPEIKLCVEYNGVKFHPKEGDTSWVGLYGDTYEYKFNYDKQKIDLIKNFGFNVIVVWEDDDMKERCEEIIEICKK